jgi:hypothetical protein
MPDNNSEGRRENAAQPLGERKGLVSDEDTKAAARKEQKVASADNISGKALGETFKKQPGGSR